MRPFSLDTTPPLACRLLIGLLLAITLLITGCASHKSDAFSASQVPPGFGLKVYRHLEGSRHTYFILTPQGELRFAGGRPALMRIASPVMTLTPAQRQELWAIVIEHKLLDVKGQGFATGKQATYEVEISTGKTLGDKDFRVVDDRIPQGVKLLHDKLFDYQAQYRYAKDPTGSVMPAKDQGQ